MMTDLSKNLKRLRQAKNLTPAELADLLHLPRESVISWERSDTTPGIDQLPAIAKALDTDVVTLLYPVAEPAEEPFRPGFGCVFGAVFLYFLLILLTGEWGIILGPVAITATSRQSFWIPSTKSDRKNPPTFKLNLSLSSFIL